MAGQAAIKDKRPEDAIELFVRAAKGVPDDFPLRDAYWLNVVIACRTAVTMHVKKGHESDGDRWAKIALETPAMAADAPAKLRRSRADAFKFIGLHLFEFGRGGLAVLCHRKAYAAFPQGGHQINIANSLVAARLPAALSDFTADVTLKELKPKILIACVPKSGSTFLYHAMTKVTAWRDFRAFGPCGQFEQELYAPNLVESAKLPGVVQQHCRATDANLHLLQAFRIRPVILVRDFADALLSLLEFYRKGAHRLTTFHADFPKLDKKEQLDLLIDVRMPWYFEFVASWQLAEREKRIPPLLWVKYEDMIADKVGTVNKVLKYYNLKAPDGRVEKVVDEVDQQKKRNRFNVGKAGRGRGELTDEQFDRMASLARYFPSTDFSMVGIGQPKKPADTPAEPAAKTKS